jgi:hypothetical protein
MRSSSAIEERYLEAVEVPFEQMRASVSHPQPRIEHPRFSRPEFGAQTCSGIKKSEPALLRRRSFPLP